MTYHGPIIDVHHHCWDYSMGRHKWLGQSTSSLKIVGDSRYLEGDYLPSQYMAEAGPEGVVASVHVEAHWDRERDGVEETAWLESIDKPAGACQRYVAWVELAREGAERRLARHLQNSSRVIGARESIRAHTDPAFFYAGSADATDPVWRSNVALLADHDLVLELLIYPSQADQVCSIASEFPELRIVVNHSASPIGEGNEARAQFREAIQMMAGYPNIYVKASNFFRYSADLAFQACLDQIASPLLDTFGPSRLMFASDFPVASRWTSYTGLVAAFKEMTQDLGAQEQAQFFHDTAAAVYRIGSLS